VVRRELVVPLQLARIGVERDNGVRVEIVAGIPRAAIPPRVGIAGSPEGQVRLRIIRAGHPDGCASVLPRIAGPRVMTWLSRLRNGLEPPPLASGAHIVRGQPAVHAVLVGRWTQYHVVF